MVAAVAAFVLVRSRTTPADSRVGRPRPQASQTTDALVPAEAAALSQALQSRDRAEFSGAFSSEIRSLVRRRARELSLPPGAEVSISAGSFQPIGDGLGTAVAVVEGTTREVWTLHLIHEAAGWRIISTSESLS